MPPRSSSDPGRSRASGPAALGGGRAEKGLSRYYQLYELLSGALREGTIAPGSLLPSEPTLCERYGVSRTTVRRALERLELEGRISRRRGSGTYARPESLAARRRLELHDLPDSLSALESSTTESTVNEGPAEVPATLRALGTGIGPDAYRLERLRRDRAGPVAFTATYLLDGFDRRLRRDLQGRASTVSLLERPGRAAVPVSWSIGAVAADQSAARALEVPLGSPLLRLRAVLSGPDGRCMAVLESLCRSDRLRVRIARAGRPPPA